MSPIQNLPLPSTTPLEDEYGMPLNRGDDETYQEILEAEDSRTTELDEYGVPLNLGDDATYQEIKEILEEMLQTEDAVKVWLESSRLGGATTPLQYILEGNLAAARRMVAALEYGIPA
jgi:hypothetical protein